MATPCLTTDLTAWIDRLSRMLDRRIVWRLLPMLTGLLFATGRRTVSSWLRRRAEQGLPGLLLLPRLPRPQRQVARLRRLADRAERGQSAGAHPLCHRRHAEQTLRPEGRRGGHSPQPDAGPGGAKFVYGHVWVTLAWVVRHPLWHAIGLPLLARMYVRQKDIDAQLLPSLRQVIFQTKLVMAAELITWAAKWLKILGRTTWVVADGAYAKRVFLQAAAAERVTVVSRLRKDAALFDVPAPPKRRGRGRPRKYGKNSISLAKRAGQRRGWQVEVFVLYGEEKTRRYKTFLATYKPAGGLIRVVLVKEDNGEWRAYFCTDVQASVREILEAVADRSAIEQVFHDVKEVHGVGQAQTRNYWTNVAVYHLSLWLHTLIELWAWHRSPRELINRRLSPWDDENRRPSHADRRNALRRQCLEDEYQAGTAAGAIPQKIQSLWRRIVRLVS